MKTQNTGKDFKDLMNLMARLRAPDGCPWDREQSFATLAPMLIEEAYEVIEAVEAKDWPGLRDELGDLLFQIVFYGQIASDEGHFGLEESIARVHEKMVRRHPHVFGEETVESTADVLVNWEAIKAEERKAAGKAEKAASLLDGVSHKLPALLEAFQLTTKAARVGFDWRDAAQVFEKIDEEMQELRVEIERPERDDEALADELGDLLFVAVNLARKLNLEPEMALKSANRKFRRRFGFIETQLTAQGRSCTEATLEEMDALWNEAKKAEKKIMKEALVVMAKAPLAGQVKTRLVGGIIEGLSQPLNAEDTANLYAAFLSDTFATLEELADERESLRLVLAYTPVGEEEAFEKVEREGSLMLPQRGGDLGERLTNCFTDLFAMGYERVVIIGGDSPTLPFEILEYAFDALNDEISVTIGPTEDGGYYLMGARQLHAALFEGIEWSSPQVFAQTRAQAENAKLTLIELPEWYDVDEPKDLARLQAEWQEEKELCYHTRRCLKAIARQMRERT